MSFNITYLYFDKKALISFQTDFYQTIFFLLNEMYTKKNEVKKKNEKENISQFTWKIYNKKKKKLHELWFALLQAYQNKKTE